MPGPTTEVLSDDLKDLKAGVRRIDVGLAEIRIQVGFAKWMLGFMAAATLSGIGSGIWWAGTITSDVRHLESRLEKIDATFDKMDVRLEKIDATFDKVDARLEKIDARFDKVDARLDGIRKAIHEEIEGALKAAMAKQGATPSR